MLSVPSLAEERRAALTYTVEAGIEGCFEPAELENAVAARLGYLPFASDAPLVMTAQVRRHGSGLDATLTVNEGGNTKKRQLGSATRDCGELSRALALAISVAIDPMSLTRSPASPPEPVAPAPTPAPAPAPPAAEPPQPAPPSPVPGPRSPSPVRSAAPAKPTDADEESRVRVRLLTGGHVSFLALPSTTGGFEAGVGLRYRSLWADTELRQEFAASAAAEGGGSGRASLLGGTLAACHGGRWFGVCLMGALARVAAQGRDVPVARSASALWAAVGPRATLELPLFGPVFARAHLDALYRLTPLRLELRQSSLWEAEPVSLTAGLGVGGRL